MTYKKIWLMLFILSTIIGLMLYDSSDGIIKIKIPNEQPKPEKRAL